MARAAQVSVLLDLPMAMGRSVLRSGLIALNLPPGDMPASPEARDQILRELENRTDTVVFMDISVTGDRKRLTLLELDAIVPKGGCRQRMFLTRLDQGYVSLADRQWVRSLGFADLYADFGVEACEGSLREALDAVTTQFTLKSIAPADLARYVRVLKQESTASSARDIIRRLTLSSAEDLARGLNASLDIQDRSFRLTTYPQCFVGTEAVHSIATQFQRTPTEALAIGQALGTLGLLVHVTHDHPFLEQQFFYRLAVSETVDRFDLGEILKRLVSRAGVAVTDRAYLGTTYPRCWVGSEAVDWLRAHYSMARHEAWIVFQRLEQFGLIEHVTRDRVVADGAYFYRFIRLAADRRKT